MNKSKYGNKKTTVDNIVFDSKKEAQRYSELKLMKMAGDITGLELQPRYVLCSGKNPILMRSRGYPNGRKMTYVADFQYFDELGNRIIEDVKGVRTDVYKIKLAIMQAMGYEVVEI